MAHEIRMTQDGILRWAFIGDLDDEGLEAWLRDIEPYLEAATPEEPMLALVDASRDGKMSTRARRKFAEINGDPRFGRLAIVNVRRVNRVMATFILRATGRNNIRFFDNEEEARAWLKE